MKIRGEGPRMQARAGARRDEDGGPDENHPGQ